MKRIFNILIAISLVFLSMSCDDSKKGTPQGFVYLEDDVFKLDGEVFFPLMINYKVDFRKIGDDVIVSPARYYDETDIYEANTKDEILKQFSKHLQLVKELGFNTIRICINIIKNDDKGYYFETDAGRLYITDNTEKIVESLDDIVAVASEKDLKVMFLMKPAMDEPLNAYTTAILQHFAEDNTIFAWDLMNEPLYFDKEPQRKKEDAFAIVSGWRDMVRKNAPHHLFTIGFAEPIEVFEWDASILPVDFVEIHTYNPLRIPNELWWYSHYIGKPWMVGEVSLPADNDSISYDSQRRFLVQAYQRTIDCGGIGFGWWEFQDKPNMNFEGEFSGLLSHENVLKPVAYEFKNLKDLEPKGMPELPVNHYNVLAFENLLITGRVVDKNTGKGIPSAMIRSWNKNWSVGLNSYTNENGEFTIYSNDECVHFEMSAPGMTKVKFDKKIHYSDADGNEPDFSNLPNRKREYQKISYIPYLKSDTVFFDFKPDMFNKAKYFGEMGDIYLEKLF